MIGFRRRLIPILSLNIPFLPYPQTIGRPTSEADHEPQESRSVLDKVQPSQQVISISHQPDGLLTIRSGGKPSLKLRARQR